MSIIDQHDNDSVGMAQDELWNQEIGKPKFKIMRTEPKYE